MKFGYKNISGYHHAQIWTKEVDRSTALKKNENSDLFFAKTNLRIDQYLDWPRLFKISFLGDVSRFVPHSAEYGY